MQLNRDDWVSWIWQDHLLPQTHSKYGAVWDWSDFKSGRIPPLIRRKPDKLVIPLLI